MNFKWRTYEQLVYNYYCNLYGERWNVKYDVQIKGQSGTDRQVDILLYESKLSLSILIDCKFYRRNVDVKDVESIIGMIEDLRMNKGVIVTTEGFTAGAEARASLFGRLELLKLSIKDLFPYRFYNNELVTIPCPNCYGKKGIFDSEKRISIVEMQEYDIVYKGDDSFFKVNFGFCEECISQIFYCNECRMAIGLELDKINTIKYCKCGVGYTLTKHVNEFGQEGWGYLYLNRGGFPLFTENNYEYIN